jgi:hypothetical protein
MTHSFEFIPFPDKAPSRKNITGHDRLYADRYHGSLTLRLTALTPVFISSGITALGSDVGESAPLLKVMGQDAQGHPILQGTSIKGCVRSLYEAITHSNVGAGSTLVPEAVAPRRKVARKDDKLTPAELVFGAMGFQGLVSIADAVGDRALEMGYLPPMFLPRSGNGRKFYRHTTAANPSTNPNDATQPEKPPSPIQQAPVGTVFTTRLQFQNLTLPQVGALLVALGQDPNYPFVLKLGAGKGKGKGSISVAVAQAQMIKGDALVRSRYLTYQPEADATQTAVADAIASAHESGLIHAESLTQLQQILQHPEVTS